MKKALSYVLGRSPSRTAAPGGNRDVERHVMKSQPRSLKRRGQKGQGHQGNTVLRVIVTHLVRKGLRLGYRLWNLEDFGGELGRSSLVKYGVGNSTEVSLRKKGAGHSGSHL
jgi:hypothetical protein